MKKKISLRVTAAWVAFVFVIVPGLRASDSFYLDLLQQGTGDYEAGDFAPAAKKLQIACFGFLDEPELLAEGLVRLSLARMALGDAPGVTRSFGRLLEIETRFGAYSAIADQPALRNEFERALPAWVGAATLERAPVFAELVERLREEQFEALPAARQRKELARRLQRDSDDTETLIALTDLEAREGKQRQANKRLRKILAQDPENQGALCAQGRLALASSDCEGALADLASCTEEPEDAALRSAYQDCLAEEPKREGLARQLPTKAKDAPAEPQPSQGTESTLPAASVEAASPTDESEPEAASEPSRVEAPPIPALPEPASKDAPAEPQPSQGTESTLPATSVEASTPTDESEQEAASEPSRVEAPPIPALPEPEKIPSEREAVASAIPMDPATVEAEATSLPKQPATAAGTRDFTIEAEDIVRAWARAWSAQDIDAYLSFYSADFAPWGGRSRTDWAELRRHRIEQPQYIELDVTISSMLIDGDRALVTFSQDYESDLFRDRVDKTLELRLEDGVWRIVRESAAP